MSEHVLVWRGNLRTGESVDPDAPRLIDMPQGLRRSRRQVKAADGLTTTSRAVLMEALAALRRQAEEPGAPVRISLRELDDHDRDVVLDLLGEGEVSAIVGGSAEWRVQESVLPGLWMIESVADPGEYSLWLEAAQVPSPVVQAAERFPQAAVTLPATVPPGAMNAMAVLVELQDRAAAWDGDGPNHVINFSLLPLTEVDADVLTGTLGQVPLVIRSEGYGSCRIFATGLRHVWAVQYLNSMGKIILDTMEVGGIPASACAAREDFEDSATRLAEILEAYAA